MGRYCGHEPLFKAEGKIESPGDKVFYRDKPMRELSERSRQAYLRMYKRMVAAISLYIEEKIFQLKKADPPPFLLSPSELDEIRQIITTYHDAFVGQAVNMSALPVSVAERIREIGLGTPDSLSMIANAFRYGQSLGNPRVKKKVEGQSFREWQKMPKAPLSDAEKRAIEFAELSAATRIRGLGNRVAEDFTTKAIEVDQQLRARLETAVRENLSANLERRETVRQLASDLGHASEDWSRDWQRIATTEKMDALLEGQAREILSSTGDDPEDTWVAKQPNPDACESCIRLYTENGKPKVFRLSELMGNGSNVGRKQKEWLPTLGPAHPFCSCELIEVSEGWGFDDDGDLVPQTQKSQTLERSLLKSDAVMSYRDSVGDMGITVRIGDPFTRQAVDEVLTRTPMQVFTRATGVTHITTDHPRAQNHLQQNDLAYWAGNEIRLNQDISPHKIRRVLEHEIGHSLNSWLMTKWKDISKVESWHQRLWKVSSEEGFVSSYAKTEPIENAAEVTRLYLYERAFLRKQFPRQFRECHLVYSDLNL